jgi:hypothetical protein
VRIEVEPSGRAWVGPVPIRVRELHVFVEDPDRLVVAR